MDKYLEIKIRFESMEDKEKEIYLAFMEFLLQKERPSIKIFSKKKKNRKK